MTAVSETFSLKLNKRKTLSSFLAYREDYIRRLREQIGAISFSSILNNQIAQDYLLQPISLCDYDRLSSLFGGDPKKKFEKNTYNGAWGNTKENNFIQSSASRKKRQKIPYDHKEFLQNLVGHTPSTIPRDNSSKNPLNSDVKSLNKRLKDLHVESGYETLKLEKGEFINKKAYSLLRKVNGTNSQSNNNKISSKTYQTKSRFYLSIAIKGLSHKVERVVSLNEGLTFEDFHRVIQQSFGWTSCSAHCFEYKGVYILSNSSRKISCRPIDFVIYKDERKFTLKDLKLLTCSKISYKYFTKRKSWWELLVTVMGTGTEDFSNGRPYLICGAGASPPEELDGPVEYSNFLRDPNKTQVL